MTDVVTSLAFWLGLAQIAYLHLLLSGDNALVIALAVRALPKRTRFLGQIWGAAGAVMLRLAFLGVVMYLLDVPFLRFMGGVLLVWIAAKLVHSDRKSTRLNSSHVRISYAVFCLKKKKKNKLE